MELDAHEIQEDLRFRRWNWHDDRKFKTIARSRPAIAYKIRLARCSLFKAPRVPGALQSIRKIARFPHNGASSDTLFDMLDMDTLETLVQTLRELPKRVLKNVQEEKSSKLKCNNF